MTSAEVEQVVRHMKGLSSGDAGGNIPIINSERAQIGELSAIDRDRIADPATAELLTRWRQQSMQFFLTQFHATSERTAAWFANVVLPDSTRLLFFVLDESGKPLGTLGLCGITANSAEIDNVNRGDQGGHKRLMHFALASLIHWLYSALGVREIYLRVLSFNSRAIALYDTIGFRQTDAAPLVKRQTVDTLVYQVADQGAAGQAEPVDFELITMALDREDFYRRHPWLSD
jgi:RimJ/RimL family protein N-acetyltransferase